jgi:hypothetical protein
VNQKISIRTGTFKLYCACTFPKVPAAKGKMLIKPSREKPTRGDWGGGRGITGIIPSNTVNRSEYKKRYVRTGIKNTQDLGLVIPDVSYFKISTTSEYRIVLHIRGYFLNPGLAVAHAAARRTRTRASSAPQRLAPGHKTSHNG